MLQFSITETSIDRERIEIFDSYMLDIIFLYDRFCFELSKKVVKNIVTLDFFN